MFQKKENNIGHLYIQCAIKNTLISLTHINGKVYKQWSTKSLKKTDLKKNNPYNLQLIVYRINKFIQLKKIKNIHIFIKGRGIGRYNVIKHLQKNKIQICSINDTTFLPFNGCRQKKQKRR